MSGPPCCQFRVLGPGGQCRFGVVEPRFARSPDISSDQLDRMQRTGFGGPLASARTAPRSAAGVLPGGRISSATHKVCRTIEIVGGERAPDRVRDQAASGEPGAGALMEFWDLVGLLGEQTRVEYVGEQVVVAAPGALGVERDDEEVSCSRSANVRVPSVPPVTASHSGPWSRSRTAVRSKKSRTSGLPGQDLVGQVADDEPVAPGERLNEVSDLVPDRRCLQGECGEL